MKRGYTLIEVAVVLLVLALAAGVIVPAAGRVADTVRIRAQVSGVAAFLRSAREQAVTRKRAVSVQLDPGAHALLLRGEGDDGAGPRAARLLAPDVQVEADPAAAALIIFYPHGLSSGGRLRIEAPGPRVYIVTVDVLTGRVRTERAAL